MVDEPPLHLLFDCDPGIDDALALAVIAHHVRAGRAVLHGIVAVGGNVGLDHTAANAAFLAERFQLDVPVWAGAALPLSGETPGDAAEVHGADGIGALRDRPPAKEPTPATAVELVAQVVAQSAAAGDGDRTGGDRVLLATGPLTNLALMLAVEPDLGRYLDRVVVMGGAFGDPSGNVTPAAEFNVWVDPEAWQVVAASTLPLEVVPLDVTTKVVLRSDDVADIEASGSAPTLVSRLIAAGIDLYVRLLHDPMCEMHDPLAAAAVFDRSLLTWRSGPITVELAGDRRGATTLEPAPAGAAVAVGVDPAVARGALLHALSTIVDT